MDQNKYKLIPGGFEIYFHNGHRIRCLLTELIDQSQPLSSILNNKGEIKPTEKITYKESMGVAVQIFDPIGNNITAQYPASYGSCYSDVFHHFYTPYEFHHIFNKVYKRDMLKGRFQWMKWDWNDNRKEGGE